MKHLSSGSCFQLQPKQSLLTQFSVRNTPSSVLFFFILKNKTKSGASFSRELSLASLCSSNIWQLPVNRRRSAAILIWAKVKKHTEAKQRWEQAGRACHRTQNTASLKKWKKDGAVFVILWAHLNEVNPFSLILFFSIKPNIFHIIWTDWWTFTACFSLCSLFYLHTLLS